MTTLARGSTSSILRSNGPTLVEVYRGHAGARKAWESLKGSQQPRTRIDDFRDLGETVLALGEVTTMGQTTRLRFTGELAQLATYRRGKLITLRDFPSHAEGLEAAGLSE